MEKYAKYIRIGRQIPAALYEPDAAGRKSRIGVLIMHSDENYLSCPSGPELARRGYTVLCANVVGKEGVIFSQNEKLLDVKQAVSFLKNYPGIDKVILMGHSGGAALMTAYQAAAENGTGIFSGREMIFPCTIDEELIPADGIMLFDANWGNSVMQLFSLDPAVTDEDSSRGRDPSLDLFNPVNGFSKDGSVYSSDFIRRFQKAQGERNSRILGHALERLRLIENGEGKYKDDEPLIIPGAAQSFFNNKLFPQDIRLMSHTHEPHPLIHKDGSVTNEIIHSVRKHENNESYTDSFREGARYLTVKTYLSSYAVRTDGDYGFCEDQVTGIDWETSCSAPPGNVRHIGVPLLAVGMTGGWEYLASETIFNMCAGKDKDIAFIEGASHRFVPAEAYEAYPGQFGDTVKLLHDHADRWLSAAGRF